MSFMDFTFLFLVVLMLFAWMNNMPMIAGAMLLVAVVSAFKNPNKLLLAGVLVAAGLAVVLVSGLGDSTGTIVVGGLFIIFLITVAADSGAPQSPYGPAY